MGRQTTKVDGLMDQIVMQRSECISIPCSGRPTGRDADIMHLNIANSGPVSSVVDLRCAIYIDPMSDTHQMQYPRSTFHITRRTRQMKPALINPSNVYAYSWVICISWITHRRHSCELIYIWGGFTVSVHE
jgi:hypothetical protein